jgi:CHAT domain-containing protein
VEVIMGPDYIAEPAIAERNGKRQAAWGVLVYLAGDIERDHEALQADLDEILNTGGSADLRIFVQHDGPQGAARYIVPAMPSPNLTPTQSLGRLDSGRRAALLDFLQWAISLCHAERLALVIGSAPPSTDGDPDRVSAFSLIRDQNSDHSLDVSELAEVIRDALRATDRKQFDLLAIDSCRVQFLELAYELENLASILIAPQTRIPTSGWNYVRLLTLWKELAADPHTQGTPRIASRLVDEIIACYSEDGKERAVSALDLQRLDDVAHAFDTLCIATLQLMGEGLIWKARAFLLTALRKISVQDVYDCASFFAIWEASLKIMADEAYQGWLGTTLQRVAGPKLDRFCEAVAQHLETMPAEATDRVAEDPASDPLLGLLIGLLRAKDRPEAGRGFLRVLDAGAALRLQLLEPGTSEADRVHEEKAARTRDKRVQAAVRKAVLLLPDERQFDLDRMHESAENARRLARLSAQATLAVLGDPQQENRGLVLSARSAPQIDDGWPRWSGVSMYRPGKLDDLMKVGNQRFAFHRRVHWAAMLGAANLIEQHPRALWRLVSSLLATGSAVTRRDVLQRLTGNDSVVWGLRDQFQVMAPAPTLTLSLERQTIPESATTAARENYVLRLESITRGAVITEQDSRVQPRVMDRALRELNSLLKQDVTTRRSLADLRSIGGLLGEDIFQSLGRTLEEERQSVRAASPDVTPHLQLQIPVELMGYPWELLHHHGEWLGERYAMGRQVFMETGLARRVPSRRQGRVRPLIIGDPCFSEEAGRDGGFKPPPQLPGARAEAEQVASWFERTADEIGSVIDFNRERDTRIHRRVTSADLRALLREGGYDIVHFAGHGVFRENDPQTSAWLMSDGPLWSLEIRNTLAEHPAPPWLVFANACEAGMDGARPQRQYQGNVFGLATAFINQGVSAYIAPLWQIDDQLAQHIALEFYRQLLGERTTLGEALRRAKAGARALAYPQQTADASEDEDDGADDQSMQDHEPVWAGLGWASLVLYGDPTEELFQALAGGSHQRPGAHASASRRPDDSLADRFDATGRIPAASRPQPSGITGTPIFPVLHGPDYLVKEWVSRPNWKAAPLDQRGGASFQPGLQPGEGQIALELIEDSGLRRWRVRKPGAADTRGLYASDDGLPGSRIAALLADDRVRHLLPAKRGVLRVVGRWILSGQGADIGHLIGLYDQEQVKEEKLLIASGTTSKQMIGALDSKAAGLPGSDAPNRALVLIHGTFSKTASPVDGFGPDFMAWARQHYRFVLGLDHWTLSKSPDKNAQLLIDELRAFNPELIKPGSLDVIAHSRGGLVARSFCELLGQGAAVRNLIFLGTPNCGTDLANSKNWGSFADLLVNMTGMEGSEPFGRLAGVLAQLAAVEVKEEIPGLLAQSPEEIAIPNTFLNRLQNAKIDRGTMRYGVVCSEFEPTVLVPNLRHILKKARDASVNATLDALFDSANDLVVNTAYAWGIGYSPTAGNEDLPAFLPDRRVLLYSPPGTKFTPPKGVKAVTALGVHHCNLFSQPRVRETIQTWLTEQ